MAGIFISYRRDDAPGDARSIHDGLVRRFGKAKVFMDVDKLLAGQRFDRELDKALAGCDVLIVVIGSRWMELLSARIGSGERDYVREEIAAALRRGIVVIPVRAGREDRMPALPRAVDLPEDIRDLVLHQRHDVAHERFGRDLADLIEAIRIAQRGGRRRVPRKAIAAVIAAALLLGVAFVLFQSGIVDQVAHFRTWEDAKDAAAKKKAEDAAQQQTKNPAQQAKDVQIPLSDPAPLSKKEIAKQPKAEQQKRSAAGEIVFKRLCVPCHDVGPDAKVKLGPPLNGLAGRRAGTIPGFNYSAANKESGITWDGASFARYIQNPMQGMPGTRMAFAGLRNETDIENLWTFLSGFDEVGSGR
jgi:cytochrome c